MLRKLLISTVRLVPDAVKAYIHNHRALDRFSRRVFSSMIRGTGDVVAVESGPMKGVLLKVSEHVSHAHILGDYEIETQLAVDRLVQPGSVCCDLGASIGYRSLLMARKAKRVYAFEPAPHAEIARHSEDVAYGSGIVRKGTQWPTMQLKTVTLDAFAQSHEVPDFIKIDVEGEEGRVLEGARAVLRTYKPSICCELHSKEAAEAVCRVLTECDYRITTLTGESFRTPDSVIPGVLQIIGLPKSSPQCYFLLGRK